MRNTSSRHCCLWLVCLCILVGCFGSSGAAQQPAGADSTAVIEPFSGKLVFHQAEGPVVYEVTITKNMVSGGVQHMKNSSQPFARIVGGWYHHQEGKLVLLIQGRPEDLQEKWLSQSQQFRVDVTSRQVILEHMLHGYGLTINDPELGTAHVLDSLEGLAHLSETK